MTEQVEQGYLLKGLTAAMLSVIPTRLHRQVDSWMENVGLRLTPKGMGLGLELGKMEYDAVFSIEEFPFKEVNPMVVIATMMAWVMDNDPDRETFELGEPSYSVEPESDNTVTIEVSVPFIETITVVEDDKGEIKFRGKTYSLQPYEVWVADKIWLHTGNDVTLIEPNK